MPEFLPFVLQGVVIGVDEFYCHRRRGLRRWERIGHPVDTLSFGVCLAWLVFTPVSSWALSVYIALAIVSSLMITKDEWEHHGRSSGLENWLHALLFVLHPVVLIWSGYLWWTGRPTPALWVGLALTSLFLVYQIVYWNVIRHDQ